MQNQQPRWSKDQGEAKVEVIPPELLPHPLVDAQLTDPPPGSEGTEPITGDDRSPEEDEPAG